MTECAFHDAPDDARPCGACDSCVALAQLETQQREQYAAAVGGVGAFGHEVLGGDAWWEVASED